MAIVVAVINVAQLGDSGDGRESRKRQVDIARRSSTEEEEPGGEVRIERVGVDGGEDEGAGGERRE